MQITFLGTGTSQGVPIIGCECDVCQSEDSKDKRLRSSIFVEWKGVKMVVDTGPDFRYQLLRAGIKDVDAVLYTHEHRDHIAGLDDIRPINFLLDKSIDVYATDLVEVALKRDYHYIFSGNNYPGIPQIQMHKIKNAPFEVMGNEIVPIEGMHYKLPVFGFRFKDFVYITDMNYLSEIEKEKIKGAKVLVLNALRREAHISHFTLQEAIDLANELEVPQVYFTHISHQLGKQQDVGLELPQNMRIAYDGLQIELDD